MLRRFTSVVNAHYRPGVRRPVLASGARDRPAVPSPLMERGKRAILEKHCPSRTWSAAELAEAHRHSFFTWGATDAMSDAALAVARGDGVYVVDAKGQRYLDWNSQAMCVNHGHTPDPSIVSAVTTQLQELAYAYPGISAVPIRAKTSALLAELVPGDINSFIYPSSGAEANEAAMRIARLYTGRSKVLCRYRSYHGGTQATLMASGDPRRIAAESGGGSSQVRHFFDPYPYSFQWSERPEEAAPRALDQLAEMFDCEGAHTIASIMIEPVTGSNGVLPPPPGYLEGVRALCDEHGILLHCDEVMSGFGRCGALFGFQRMAPSVVPDIVTFAKGLNGAFLPLAAVGFADPIATHFRTNPITYGSTYNGHPVALASAYAALQVLLRDGMVENAAAMEEHMQVGFEHLADKHGCIKQVRGVGLFWAMDIQKNRRGDFISAASEPLAPAMVAFRRALVEDGLLTTMRGHTVFANPPLIITPEQIQSAFQILDRNLCILDAAMVDSD